VTPWQADTLLGALASACARAHGAERLQRDLLDSWLAGEPPFVLSDAFPGDFLPAPACLPLWPWREEKRKLVKRTEWLAPEQFRELQSGRQPALPDEPPKPLERAVRMRNALDRQLNTTGAAGSLYEASLTVLAKEVSYLSLYARITPGKEPLLTELLGLLAESGFGADASVGQGQFKLQADPVDASWLAESIGVNAWISLSTFQPARGDSTDGYWRSFVKYGKLGPDFGVEGVFKRPQWMLRPGACFREQGPMRDWYGRVIGTDQLLPEGGAGELTASDVRPLQPAFGLAVPMNWANQYDGLTQ
jgi:CRISPR-associated protein Csm4